MKKPLTLILALLLTTSLLAACGASPQSALSSSAPSSTAFPSSVTPSSIAPSSISASPSASSSSASATPPSSSSQPPRHHELIEETADLKTYYADVQRFYINNEGKTYREPGQDTSWFPLTFSIPSYLYFTGSTMMYDEQRKLGDLAACLHYDDSAALVAHLGPYLSIEKSNYESYQDAEQRTIHYDYYKSPLGDDGYIYPFIIDLGSGLAVNMYFYVFNPGQNYDPTENLPLYRSIVESIHAW